MILKYLLNTSYALDVEDMNVRDGCVQGLRGTMGYKIFSLEGIMKKILFPPFSDEETKSHCVSTIIMMLHLLYFKIQNSPCYIQQLQVKFLFQGIFNFLNYLFI